MHIMEAIMYQPDFGYSNDPWTKEQDMDLLKSVLTIYRDSILGGGGKGDVCPESIRDQILAMNPVGSRSEGAIMRRIGRLLDYNPQFGDIIAYYSKCHLFAVKEFCKLEEVKDLHFPKKNYKNELSNLLEKLKSEYKDDRIKSTISLISNGDDWLYSYPTDINADYADIFWQVFSRRNKWNGKTPSFFSWSIDKNNNFTSLKWKEDIPIKEHFIRSSCFYLLDFLLAKTANALKEQDSGKGQGKPRQRYNQHIESLIKEIPGQLKKFQKISGYHNTHLSDIEDAYKGKERIDSLIRNGKDNEDVIQCIMVLHEILACEESLKIPQFIIKLPAIFEIYIYSILDDSPNICYQNERNGGKADIVDFERNIVVEVKYKFQYLNGELDSEDQEQLKKREESYGGMKVLIAFPKLQELYESNNKTRLTECSTEDKKVAIVLPRNPYKWRTHIPKSREFTEFDFMNYEEDNFVATIDQP